MLPAPAPAHTTPLSQHFCPIPFPARPSGADLWWTDPLCPHPAWSVVLVGTEPSSAALRVATAPALPALTCLTGWTVDYTPCQLLWAFLWHVVFAAHCVAFCFVLFLRFLLPANGFLTCRTDSGLCHVVWWWWCSDCSDGPYLRFAFPLNPLAPLTPSISSPPHLPFPAGRTYYCPPPAPFSYPGRGVVGVPVVDCLIPLPLAPATPPPCCPLPPCPLPLPLAPLPLPAPCPLPLCTAACRLPHCLVDGGVLY